MPSRVANFRSRGANRNRNGRGKWAGGQIVRLGCQTELAAGKLVIYEDDKSECREENIGNDLNFAP
jgi:hypothetical protein